jgi:DNA-binding beta-propeller fold protein YncE
VADSDNQRIRKISSISPTFPTLSPTRSSIITAYGGTGSGGYSGDEGDATSAMINGPRGIAIDSGGNVYFSDLSNGCVRKITASTGIITTYAGGFNLPNGLFVDSSGINNYLSHIKHIFLSLLC